MILILTSDYYFLVFQLKATLIDFLATWGQQKKHNIDIVRPYKVVMAKALAKT